MPPLFAERDRDGLLPGRDDRPALAAMEFAALEAVQLVFHALEWHQAVTHLMTVNRMTMASDREPAVLLRTATEAAPAPVGRALIV